MHLATWMEVQISSVSICLGPPPFFFFLFSFFFKIKIELVPNFTIFSLQILGGKFLWAITSRQKSNFNNGFKLKTCNNRSTKIYYKNIINVTLL